MDLSQEVPSFATFRNFLKIQTSMYCKKLIIFPIWITIRWIRTGSQQDLIIMYSIELQLISYEY